MTPSKSYKDKKSFWMPFTDNESFLQTPRLFSHSKGMYYQTIEGQDVLDATSGMWCVNAGNGRSHIAKTIQSQAEQMLYCPPFQLGHEQSFALADRLIKLAPDGLNHAFFSNSGSESVDTALKIALAYFKAIGKPSKKMLIGRSRGYHGVGFGGISVGGIPGNREPFDAFLPKLAHLPDTHRTDRTFEKGQRQPDAVDLDLANALEQIIEQHGSEQIAAVIVEPVAGSTGVLIPPSGYLQRLREICTNYDILLIFDEVITGFGRVGDAFASVHWGVTPDIFTMAKGLTNGAVPMGATMVKDAIYQAFMQRKHGIELFHGYTYSAHPLAVAAAHASLDIYENENLFDKANTLHNYWQDAIHQLNDKPHVIDIRNYGLMGAIELEPDAKGAGVRAMSIFNEAFFNQNLLIRASGDTIALSPPLIVEPSHIDSIFEKLHAAFDNTLN